MLNPLDRPPDQPPHDPTPAELETILGRGALERWDALAPVDRNRIARDLEALQRTARELANATRELHDGVTAPDECEEEGSS
jgi:hypothetical protein